MHKFILYSALSCLLAVGCGPKTKINTVPASGVITYQGKPLEDAQVGFVDTAKPDALPANGRTDAAGKFTLRTYLGGKQGADGIQPGSYTVIVTKYENPAGPMPTSPDEAIKVAAKQAVEEREKRQAQMRTGQGQPMGPVLVTPQKYSTPQTSDLKVTIKESGNEPITLELKDE